MQEDEKRLVQGITRDFGLSDTGPYTVFTCEFDRVVSWRDLPRERLEDEYIPAFAKYLSPGLWFERGCQASGVGTDALLQLPEGLISEISVIVLADHSGSLKNDDKRIIAWLLLELLDREFSRLGIPFEILGYTTSSWRGGESRLRWKQNGCPDNPGRLCDLLHIVYRSFSDQTSAESRYQAILDPRLLKENVDGEAICWAVDRMRDSRKSKRQFLLVISDGVAVDDSTLHENGNYYLQQHLETVVAEVDTWPDWKIGAILLDNEPYHIYPDELCIGSKEEIAGRLGAFLRAFFEVPEKG